MRPLAFVVAFSSMGLSLAAQQTPTDGPYKVQRTVKVGGEGGFDYIYADVAGRRLYIPRGGQRAVPATDSTPAKPATAGRITVFDLETIAPLGEIPETGGNGVVVDPKSGHGFSSATPAPMFDTKTLQKLKTIDPPSATFRGDGIYFDPFNDRVYVFSHPTKQVQVIDPRDGSAVGVIDLGGVPEQAISDGKGTLYVVLQDVGAVAVVDAKAMKVTAQYPFGDNVGCNGLALDNRNHVLFATCGRLASTVTGQPAQPMMVILGANDGKIITKLPLAGSSDGAVFNPATMEAFSSHSNGTMTIVRETSPAIFEVEQNLNTMLGARTLTLDTKTNRIFVMSVERGPAPPPLAAGGRAGQAPVIPGSFSILVIGK